MAIRLRTKADKDGFGTKLVGQRPSEQDAGATITIKQYDKPKKAIWLRPLRKDWKRTLNW